MTWFGNFTGLCDLPIATTVTAAEQGVAYAVQQIMTASGNPGLTSSVQVATMQPDINLTEPYYDEFMLVGFNVQAELPDALTPADVELVMASDLAASLHALGWLGNVTVTFVSTFAGPIANPTTPVAISG